ncbi:MAG: septum site-determining protein MinC [Anaerolineales bacterium]|nr:septum site-determining protein MinC [Anaerolineales bacterium]
MSDPIQIKGLREGLLVTLGDGPWEEIAAALLQRVTDQPAFFQGARLALDIGAHELRVVELSALRDQLSERGMTLWAILSESPTTEQTAQNLGMATRISKPRPEDARPVFEAPAENVALWVHQTVRSGTRIEFAGPVVVLGDVNPGGEIMAGGSVIVWGRLRGVVHAGAQGDEKAVVCALDLAPTQLRIAAEIAVSPQRSGKSHPEIACLRDGQIVAELWQAS